MTGDQLGLTKMRPAPHQTTRSRRTVVLKWSDDNEDPIAPPPSTQAPLSSTRMEEQPRGSEQVPEHQATEVPAGQATGVPEQQAEVNPERRTEKTSEQQVE
jgi:hypothetical protein